jgi:hypothetical protein
VTIATLINKQDNVEIIRDKIGQILLAEVAAQKALAIAASEDPVQWNLRVFTDRTNPWNEFLQAPDQGAVDATPLVNIHFDSSSVDGRASNVVTNQTYDGVFNCDVYGYGVSAYAATGHTAGDYKASSEAHRGVRLVRNILMAAEYTYLDLPGTVTKRMVQTIDAFRPPLDEKAAIQVHAHRIRLGVRYYEEAPVASGAPLETISVGVLRKETGEIYLTAEYDVT